MVDYFAVNQLCGRDYWGFCFSALVGSEGGILCYWDKVVFKAIECVSK